MSRLPILCLFALCAALPAALSGCGTMANMYNASGAVPPRVFGGIATDLEAVEKGDLLGIVDLPGSLVGDLITLPDVLSAREDDERRETGAGESDAGDKKPAAPAKSE